MEYNRKCKCCQEEFVTNRIDQYFLNRLHQVSFNNKKQSRSRQRLAKYNKPMNETYRIYKKLLKIKSEITITKEFLRGRGANFHFFNNVELIDGERVNCLFDIGIIPKGEHVILKKVKNG
ncbi:MAG: hypothetical protein RIQ59_211 [Bacteroidota bacterium]|jgi:hypothetical protein